MSAYTLFVLQVRIFDVLQVCQLLPSYLGGDSIAYKPDTTIVCYLLYSGWTTLRNLSGVLKYHHQTWAATEIWILDDNARNPQWYLLNVEPYDLRKLQAPKTLTTCCHSCGGLWIPLPQVYWPLYLPNQNTTVRSINTFATLIGRAVRYKTGRSI